MVDLPKYRARILNSEEYVVGFLYICEFDGRIEYYITPGMSYQITQGIVKNGVPIHSNTLAINLPGVFDIDKNPIFASLSQDCKGGDIVDLNHFKHTPENFVVCAYRNGHLHFVSFNGDSIDRSTMLDQIVHKIPFENNYKVDNIKNFHISVKTAGIYHDFRRVM